MSTIFTIIFVLGVLLIIAMSALAQWIAMQTRDYWANKRLIAEMETGLPHPAEFHEHNEELARLRERVQRQERLLPWWKRCYRVGIVAAAVLLGTAAIWLVLLAAGALP